MKYISVRRDLSLQLVLLYLLFVGLIVIGALYSDKLTSEKLENDVKAANLALARAIAQETDNALRQDLLAVRELAEYPEVIRGDLSGMEEIFSIVLDTRPDVSLVFRLNEMGVMLYHYPADPDAIFGEDFSKKEYFLRAGLTTRSLISKGRIFPVTGQPVATVVMPIWDERANFLGVVAMNIKLESLSQSLAKIAAEYDPEENFSVIMVDATGKIIAHPDPNNLLIDNLRVQTDVTKAVLLGQSGNLVSLDETNQERLYSYVPVSRVGWGVIVSQPISTAYATAYAFHKGVLIAVAVFLGFGFFFWLALARQVIRPLGRLAAFSLTVGQEQEIHPTEREELNKLSTRLDQVGHLAHSLLRMEEAIHTRFQELATLMETSAAVVSTLDSQIVLDRILEQVERLLDVKMSAVVAMDEKRGSFVSQASRGISKPYADQIMIAPTEEDSITLQAIRTGRPIQISDVEKDPTFLVRRPRAHSAGYRSILAIPLKTQFSPPAVLLIFRPTPHVFSSGEIDLLSNFANHATMAIENASLYASSDMRLQEQTRRLEALIQSLNDGLILADLEGHIIYANRRISELSQLPADEISGKPVDELLDWIVKNAIDPKIARQSIVDAINSQPGIQSEIGLSFKGQPLYLRLQPFAVTDTAGVPIGRGLILLDITTDRELDRLKSSLISTVSHELRTPLASIKGYATTLLADDVEWDPQSQRDFLNVISDEIDRLSDLVSDLLDLSRIEAGSLVVTRTACDLRDLINTAALRAQPQPGDRLQIYLEPGLPSLKADPKRIEAVLRNLIENASKYAGDSSPIRVSAIHNNGKLIIKVEDEGPGIPVEHRHNIFDSFYRPGVGKHHPASGLGLGLAICQGFVKAHGGDIWVEPRSHGACIAFSLPLDDQTT
jgi:PAS domain S-box-containing protein